MAAAFIITFREFLEIAIILTIILVATRGVAGRGRWVGAGILGGVVGAALVAVFANNISNAMEGMGQELFNAIILFVAVLMIIWTVVWMQSHGRALAQKMKQVGKAVAEGEVPLYSLALVVSIAMWREGAEIVILLAGTFRTSQEPAFQIIGGALAGALSATVIGLLLYFGLIKLSSRHLFSVTGWLLIFLACGMSAQMAGYLNAADMLPALGQAWDSGWLISQSGIMGQILHAMIGYSERPSGMQIIFYIATLLIILALQKMTGKPKARA
jgi:high-affinity iron transporter